MTQVRQLTIHGMTCAACAQASERAVKKLAGVEEAAVNFATEKLLIKFEDGKLGIDEIDRAARRDARNGHPRCVDARPGEGVEDEAPILSDLAGEIHFGASPREGHGLIVALAADMAGVGSA